jgi:hypothetical protein
MDFNKEIYLTQQDASIEKKDEVIGDWGKLHNEETVLLESRRARWAEHVAQMGRSGMHVGYWWESWRERDH